MTEKVGIGAWENYNPVYLEFMRDGVWSQYYLKDLQAWASGDTTKVEGIEALVIQVLSQLLLNHLTMLSSGALEEDRPVRQGVWNKLLCRCRRIFHHIGGGART